MQGELEVESICYHTEEKHFEGVAGLLLPCTFYLDYFFTILETRTHSCVPSSGRKTFYSYNVSPLARYMLPARTALSYF